MTTSIRLILALAIAALAPSAARAQTALPMGSPANGTTTGDSPTEYTVEAKTAGVLSVAVQGTGDLALTLVDEDGQTLPDGNADSDLYGSEGTELLSVTIGEPGRYRLRVRLQGGGSSSTFQIAGSFLGFPAFARPGDPDRRPTLARALQVGKPHEDSLDPEGGDSWDWFAFKVPTTGALALITRAVGDGEPDLVLEVYLNGEFSRPEDRSDQDMQGIGANESVTVNVTAGQTVHVKVSSNFNRGAKYRLSSSVIQ